MISIELGNIGCKKQAEKIKSKIEGETFFNFKVEYANYMGNYPVTVSTDHSDYTEDEVKDMLLFVLASEL